MYSSKNDTQFQHKMHFHKTVQDLPIYNIHKHFEVFDASELSVEDIINTVFFDCEDKKHAQICAQTYICHRIISKAKELQRTAIFYQDPYELSKTMYEEPIYILVNNKIAGIAKKILSHPAILFLSRCSRPLRKRKAPKQKKQKNSYTLDKSLKSIVGKFPSLIIPKLSSKEIEYHMKARYRIFDLEKNSLTKKKDKTLKKTKHIKRNKENLQNAEIKRSHRLRLNKEKIALNVQANFLDNFSFGTEANSLEDHQQVEIEFLKNNSVPTEICMQEDSQQTETYFRDDSISETKSHTNDMTPATSYRMNDQVAKQHFQEDIQCLSFAEINFQKDNDLTEKNLQILEGENSIDEIVDNETDTEDTCEHLEDEIGLDKEVVASLRELYKSVHNGKNNYIFCELSY